MTRRMWWKSKSTGQWKNSSLENVINQVDQIAYSKLQDPDTLVDNGVLVYRAMPRLTGDEELIYWTIYRPGSKYYLEPEKVPEEILLILLIEGN